RDVSGKGNHGTIAGAEWTTAKIGGGLKFDGTSHYVSVPRVNLDELSISGWFYKNAKDTTNADAVFSAFNKGATAQAQEGYEIRFMPSDPETIEFMLITQNADGTLTSKIARNNLTNSVGKWYHVAGVYCKSTGEQKLYVNGQQVSTLVHSPGNTVVPLTSYSDMRIGYSRVSTGYFNGSIDDIRIYNGVLSDQEILDLYNSATDSSVPSGSIVINDGALYSNSTSVTLNLLATDNIGVTGYYLSMNSTTPQANASGWIPVTLTKNFTAPLPYVFSNDAGSQTVYAWYKDAMGNVSEMASASITLDTIVPVVTIMSPTPDAAYTTTDMTISLAGTVIDDGSGVNNVTWKSDRGGSGDASGTSNWTISDVSLTDGDNRITVMTTDKAGNTGLSTITVKSGLEPTVITGASVNVTSVSATLLGTVNGGGLRTSAWFEYGAESGVYENITPAQDVTGATNIELTVDVTGLVEGKEYYYRIVAQNNAGTKQGSEMTLKTPDMTVPGGLIVIKDGDDYTNTTTVPLKLIATDNVGITGYYLSTSDVIPEATAEGWTDVTSTANYSANIQYTLSDGEGNKTLYVWYKDEAGNMSGTASDSVDVDTKSPEINIMSPTSDAAYITTASMVYLGGSAADTGSAIQSVMWSSDSGRSGEADGTTSWAIGDINLEIGDTAITVTAKDVAGNTGTASITVTYGVVPAVTTASATNVKADTATLNGMVNAGGLSTTVWFEYGTTTGTYNTTSPSQVINGLNDVAVNADITGLLESKVYYYRVVAQNIAGTVYGNEMTLKTLDTSAPQGSIVINSGDAYTNSTSVKVNLLATDNEGITGYYFSANNVTPLATAEGWTNVTPSPAYGASVSYTFGSGDGIKTLYVWYKDADGNVSGTVSDSIELDTTAPVVVITSPVSGDTYSTTSVLINLGGTASDDRSGISRVIWSTDKNSSGTASGATSWTISTINLTVGDTVITVTATDGAGNTGMTTITVNYSGAPVQAGLSALYVFDEGSGATALDTSGNGNNGTINDATWTTGKIGSALSFDGTSSYILLSNTLDAFSEFTCAAWVKADDLSVKRGIFTSGGFNTSGFRFRINTNGSVWMLMAGGDSYNTLLTAAGVVKSGLFYHITVTGKSGQYMRIYVNGELAKEKVTTQTVTTPTASGYIGTSWSKTSELMKGVIDDVRIYKRALSNQEVLDVYNTR
ncbi:MAG: LamG-like jellyroll fold domain-containing protein, partial [Candidatus Brocadiaceae bacterium]